MIEDDVKNVMFYSMYKMSITENEFGYIYIYVCFMLRRFGSRHVVQNARVTTRGNPHVENP